MMRGRAKKGTLAGAGDGFDSYKSANFRRHGQAMADMKGAQMSNAAGYTFKTQAVLLFGWRYDLYVLDPTIAANANFSIECLHRSLVKFFDNLKKEEDAVWPSQFYFQVKEVAARRCVVCFHVSNASYPNTRLMELQTTSVEPCSCMQSTWCSWDSLMLSSSVFSLWSTRITS